MLKLRKILLHSTPFYILLLIAILITGIRLFLIPKTSSLTGKETKILGIIDSYHLNSDKLTIKVKYKKEYIHVSYFFKTKKEAQKNLEKDLLGRIIILKGILEKPQARRVENGFSYKDYLKTENTYYLMKIETLELGKMTNSPYYHTKNLLENIIRNKKSASYLKTFILGNDEDIKKEVKLSFRQNGISHLFAISGMHISLLSGILLILLQKLKIREEKRYFLVSLFLLFYLLLTFSPSVLRATIFFLLFSINRINYFYIKPFHIFLLTLTICLLINPYFIYNIGFQYSFLISGVLILSSDYINKGKNMLSKTLKTSLLSFFSSSIITLNHFYEVNFLSILYNLIYVPFISYLVFPLSILTCCCPILDNILYLLIEFLEKTSLFLANIRVGKIILGKPSLLFTLCYTLIFFLFLKYQQKKKKSYYILFLPLFLIQLIIPSLNQKSSILMLDIGQGDSILLHSKNKVVLIDTGGISSFSKKGFKKRERTKIAEQITIPYLKSKGIKKIDILVLTHGDYDHLGDSDMILKHFPVNKIYINNNKLNSLEQKLKKKNLIHQLKKDQVLNLGGITLYSLNDDLKDENDSSIVLLAQIENRKIMLMGDASCKTEKNILKEYHLEQVDILKVGHHGSKTSSCEEFLDVIKPKIALISAGRNNKFKHPHRIVLERFQKRKIKYFVTSDKGSIKIDLSSMTVKNNWNKK